jgi:hypothetical protein
MIEFILKHLKEILLVTGGVVLATIVGRYKKAIADGTNFVIDWLLSLVRIYFLILKRYKKSIIRSYRETKVGYRNLRLDLERNYISLKVHSFVHYKQKDADEEIRSEKMDILEVMKKHRHLVILGGPGAGKTTLMQWLLLKFAYGQMKEELGETLIPVFIALRSLESGQSVDDLLLEVLKQHHFKKSDSFIRKQMEKGKCLLIFDGMDEIVDETTRKKFIDDICNTYGNLYGKSRILITSRTEGYPNDPFPGSFREREILDLDMEQVRNFINGILKQEDKPEGLIQQIEKSEGLKKFVTNPLMLSLLTFVYQESYQKLPNDRVKVYDKCMQLMLEDRDASKGIYEYRNKFDADDKELLLSKLAYDFSLINRWRFTEKELLEHWRENLPANLKEKDLKKLLEEVCIANGILKHFSGKELGFLHRTFQEYYAAKEICKKEQELFNSTQFNIHARFIEKEWYEITMLLVGMMEDATQLIKRISSYAPQIAIQCLVYAKRAKVNVISEVVKSISLIPETENILETYNNLVYLTHRYGLEEISKIFVNALDEIDSDESKKDLWKVIDHVMLAFSPQKNMVYVTSGVVQCGKEPGEWMPGSWMDMHPVTNENYYSWVKNADIKGLPRQWESKADKEPLVTEVMKSLPIVDVTYGNASAYSSHLNKRLPYIKEFRYAEKGKNNTGGGGLLTENRLNYLKKNKLKKNFYFYRNAVSSSDLASARALARNLSGSSALACDLSSASALAIDIATAYGFAHGDDLDFDHARELELDSKLELYFNLSRDLELARDLAQKIDLTRALDLARELARELARDFALAVASSHALDLKFEKLVNHFGTARKAVNIIEKEFKEGWTKKAWEKTFELGKALVDALVTFLEILQPPVPENLLMALRHPGLLTPVNEFPPNELGICGLVGNVWEWTSTKNKKGEYLICGGAWTEEKYDPDKEEWRPPEWRDINLGFRCVCDWDKIGEVKEPASQ